MEHDKCFRYQTMGKGFLCQQLRHIHEPINIHATNFDRRRDEQNCKSLNHFRDHLATVRIRSNRKTDDTKSPSGATIHTIFAFDLFFLVSLTFTLTPRLYVSFFCPVHFCSTSICIWTTPHTNI